VSVYTPGLSGQALYSKLCLMFICYSRIWTQSRHFIGRMPDHYKASAFYTFWVDPRFCQYCKHL